MSPCLCLEYGAADCTRSVRSMAATYQGLPCLEEGEVEEVEEEEEAELKTNSYLLEEQLLPTRRST